MTPRHIAFLGASILVDYSSACLFARGLQRSRRVTYLGPHLNPLNIFQYCCRFCLLRSLGTFPSLPTRLLCLYVPPGIRLASPLHLLQAGSDFRVFCLKLRNFPARSCCPLEAPPAGSEYSFGWHRHYWWKNDVQAST